MSDRNPKVDPVPGDVLRKGASTVEVLLATEEGLGYRFSGQPEDVPPMPDWWQSWKPKWRKWARNAEVIQRGDAHGK